MLEGSSSRIIAAAIAAPSTQAYYFSIGEALQESIRESQAIDRLIERVAGEKAAGLKEPWLGR